MGSARRGRDDRGVEQALVIVAANALDLRVAGVASAVDARDDMALVGGHVVALGEVGSLLASIASELPCAVICVSRLDGDAPVGRWLAQRAGLVVLNVDLGSEGPAPALRFERFAPHDMRLDSMLHGLRELMLLPGGERVLHFKLHLPADAEAPLSAAPDAELNSAPVLAAALDWLHELLLTAIHRRHTPMSDPTDGADEATNGWVGFGISAAAVQHAMVMRAPLQELGPEAHVQAAAERMLQAVSDAAPAGSEPLAALVHRLALTPLEVQLALLALAPELDERYQRCMAVLLDDASRRVGTLGLYTSLLGEPVVLTQRLLGCGGLQRWRLLGAAGTLPSADEALRFDAAICAWLLGDANALDADARVRRVTRSAAWPGIDLFQPGDRFRASSLASELRSSRGPLALVLAAESPAYALALLEHGAQLRDVLPLRVDAVRLSELDAGEVVEAAMRLARAALLEDRPLIVDASAARDETLAALLAALLATLATTPCRFGIVASDVQAIIPALGNAPFKLETLRQSKAERVELVRGALARAGAPADDATAQFISANFPLQIDGFDAALRLAQAHAGDVAGAGADAADAPTARERFVAGCRAIALQGVSHFAERIEPGFELADVVLPPDRAEQLREIVASVRLAPMVLDQWDFQRQLPYGRGTTALFHGPSGTGKTMAAHAIARALNVHVLRLDLSRVVSKYIGETERHCDRVFSDATNSGAAILIDEADALFGKRSEVKDAHDRYANIEVAFLLQRIESFDGLAILTTNLRQNLDPAFLRRLRFIVEFPRPDVRARAAIWQACLPSGAHRVSAAELGELARRIDLTGGHIRQITLRAAFLAADRGELIEVPHLLAAARSELAKLGMSAVGLDTPVLAPARRVA